MIPARIQSVFNLLKRVGFVVLLATLLLSGGAHPVGAEIRILWTAELRSTPYVRGYSIVESSAGLIIVGSVKDDWMAPLTDACVHVLDAVDGHEVDFARHHLGLNSTYRQVVLLADESLALCGQLHTFDGLYAVGFVAHESIHGDTLWTRVTRIPESRNTTTITASSDTTFVVNAEWQDAINVVGRQVFSLHMAESGATPDSSLTPYLYGQYVNIADAVEVPDGGEVAVGSIYRLREPLLHKSLYVRRTDEEMDTLWTRTITLPDTELYATSVDVSPTGEIYVAGSINTIPSDARLFKFTSEGDEIWRRSYYTGNPGSIASIVKCRGDSILLFATYETNAFYAPYFAILDEDGNLLQDTIIRVDNLDLSLGDVALSGDGNIVYLATNGAPEHVADGFPLLVFSIAIDSGMVARELPNFAPQSFELSVFPNPFNSTLSISLDVPLYRDVTLGLYDLLGREVDVVYRGRLASSTISYVAPDALSSGVYFLRASTHSQSVLTKVVLLK